MLGPVMKNRMDAAEKSISGASQDPGHADASEQTALVQAMESYSIGNPGKTVQDFKQDFLSQENQGGDSGLAKDFDSAFDSCNLGQDHTSNATLDSLNLGMHQINSAFSVAGSALSSLGSTAGSALSSCASTAISAVSSGISKGVSAVSSGLSLVGSGISSIASTAGSAVSSGVSKGASAISSTLSSVGSKVDDGLSTAASATSNAGFGGIADVLAHVGSSVSHDSDQVGGGLSHAGHYVGSHISSGVSMAGSTTSHDISTAVSTVSYGVGVAMSGLTTGIDTAGREVGSAFSVAGSAVSHEWGALYSSVTAGVYHSVIEPEVHTWTHVASDMTEFGQKVASVATAAAGAVHGMVPAFFNNLGHSGVSAAFQGVKSNFEQLGSALSSGDSKLTEWYQKAKPDLNAAGIEIGSNLGLTALGVGLDVATFGAATPAIMGGMAGMRLAMEGVTMATTRAVGEGAAELATKARPGQMFVDTFTRQQAQNLRPRNLGESVGGNEGGNAISPHTHAPSTASQTRTDAAETGAGVVKGGMPFTQGAILQGLRRVFKIGPKT